MDDKNCGPIHKDPKKMQKRKFKLILPYQKDNTKRQTLIWKKIRSNIIYITLLLCSFQTILTMDKSGNQSNPKV
jgi:hypothetical protein